MEQDGIGEEQPQNDEMKKKKNWQREGNIQSTRDYPDPGLNGGGGGANRDEVLRKQGDTCTI